MRGMIVLALALLFAALLPGLHAQVLPPEIAGSIELSMDLQSQTLASDGSSVQLLTLDGRPSFIVENGQLVTDSARIQALLEKNITLNSGFDDALSATRDSLTALQAVRSKPEAYCAQLTAVDRFPCFDKVSCVKTAQANPQTASMINAEGFWEAMVGWQASRMDFNDSINALSATLQSPLATADYASGMQASMSGVQAKFDLFMHNDLYRTRYDADCTKFNRSTCFEYCPRTNWTGYSNWSSTAAAWASVGAKLDSLGSQAARAQSLAQATSDWLNYTKNRQALWSAMDHDMQARQNELDANISASNNSWSDASLSADILAWKQSLNATRALAVQGRIHAALGSKLQLLNQSDTLLARIADHMTHMEHIQNSIRSVRLAVAQLAKSGNNQSAAFAASLAVLEKAATPPIPADQLGNLENQSANLEQLTLAEVARAALGAPPSSRDTAAEAQVIVSNLSNETINASRPPAAGKFSLPFGLQCPLSLGLLGLVGLLALLRSR